MPAKKTQDAVCKSNLKQLGLSVSIYVKNNKSYAPKGPANKVQNWTRSLIPELLPAPPAGKISSALRCPTQTERWSTNLSLNVFATYFGERPLSTASGPTSSLLGIDSYANWLGIRSPQMNLNKLADTNGDGVGIARHFNKANTLFIDSHVKALKTSYLLTKNSDEIPFWKFWLNQ